MHVGGEHTLSYYQLKALAKEDPVVIHFDAHRDMKPKYEGMKMCHTTPFYHLLQHIPGENMIQIGIRQADREENETAGKNGVTTFDAWQVHDDIDAVADHLQSATAGRKIYISFDIDVYDLPTWRGPDAGQFWTRPFQVLNGQAKPVRSLIGWIWSTSVWRNDDYGRPFATRRCTGYGTKYTRPCRGLVDKAPGDQRR